MRYDADEVNILKQIKVRYDADEVNILKQIKVRYDADEVNILKKRKFIFNVGDCKKKRLVVLYECYHGHIPCYALEAVNKRESLASN